MASAFGEELRRARRAQGETIASVAAHTGFSTSYVSDVENGRRSPFEIRVIESIATFLGVDRDALLLAASVSRGAIVFDVNADTPTEVVGLLYSIRERVRDKKPTSRRSLVAIIRKAIA